MSAIPDGTDSGSSDSGYQSDVGFTPDGRIVFESRATDLDPRSGDLRSDVFIATAPAEADFGIGLDAADQPRVVVCHVGTLPAGGGAEVRVTATVTAHGGGRHPDRRRRRGERHPRSRRPAGGATLASPVVAP